MHWQPAGQISGSAGGCPTSIGMLAWTEKERREARISGSSLEANAVVGTQNNKDVAAKEKAEQKAIHDEIGHLTTDIQATGNKEAIANLKIITEHFKNNPVAELAALTRDWVMSQQQQKHQTNQAFDDLRKSISNLGHP